MKKLIEELNTILFQQADYMQNGLLTKAEKRINGEKWQGQFDYDYNRLARAKEILKELKGGEF